MEARITEAQLQQYGFDATRLKNEAGFNAFQLKNASFDADQLKKG